MNMKAKETLPDIPPPSKPHKRAFFGQMHILLDRSGNIVKLYHATGIFEKYIASFAPVQNYFLLDLFDTAQHPRLLGLIQESFNQNSLEATIPWEGHLLKLSFYEGQNKGLSGINLNISAQSTEDSYITDKLKSLLMPDEAHPDEAMAEEEAQFIIDQEGHLHLTNEPGKQYIGAQLKKCEEDNPHFLSMWPSQLQGFWKEKMQLIQSTNNSFLKVSKSQLPQHPLFDQISQIKMNGLGTAQNPSASLHIQCILSSKRSYLSSYTFLQAVLQDNQMGWAIWAVDTDLNILFANDVANKFKLKASGNALIPGTDLRSYWPEATRAHNLAAYQKALRGETVEVERQELTKLPNSWAKIYLQPLISDGKILGILGRGQFIDEQKKTEADLRKANAYKTTLLNSSNQAIWAIDRDYKLLFFNTYHAQMQKRILGCEPKIGDSVLDYIQSSELRQSSINLYDQALKGHHTSREKCIIDLEGKELWSEFEFNPIFDGDKILGVMGVSRDITERKLTEKKLKESENSLKEAQAIASIGNWSYDHLENKHYWSQEMRSIFGVPPEEPVPDYEHFVDFIIPEDRPKVQKIITRLMSKEITTRENYRIMSREGKEKHVMGLAKSIANEEGKIIKIVGVVQDVSKTRHIELELRNQKEFLENLINNLPIAVFVKDIKNDYRLTTWNRKCEEIYGISKENALGKNDFELFDSTTALQFHQTDEEVMHQESVHYQEEVLIPRNDKTVYVYQVKVPIKDVDGRPSYILGIEEDITERLQREKELILAKEKAEEATRAKTDFLATMSHEIRTPMNAVVGITNLLIEESLSPEQLSKIQALKFSAKNLLDIINDILDYNKIEAGKVELEQTEFSLLELCRNIKHTYEYQAQEKGIQLKLILDDDIPATLLGDSTRIFQILNNLVSNAVKFTEQGMVKLTVHFEDDYKDKVRVFFKVRDTGIGIPPDKQKIIFERYTQSGQDTTRRFGGSGLGLAICKGLLDLLGSEIELKSEPGKGSQFAFYLDLHKSDNLAKQGEHKKEIKDWNGLKNARVLVAEDNPVNQFVIQGYLHKWLIDFEFANDGQEAIHKLQEGSYDLILMDLQMPKMNGLDAAKKIRNMEAENFRNIPIIALTASASSEVRNKVDQIGMNDYVSKPFQPNDLYCKMLKYYTQSESIVSNVPETQTQASNTSSTLASDFNLAKYFEITHDDPSMYQDLLKLTFREFNNFMMDYREGMEQRDLNRIRSLVHKSSPTMQLLEFNGLIHESSQGKHILHHPNPEDNWISKNIKEVEKHCLALLHELSQRASISAHPDMIKI